MLPYGGLLLRSLPLILSIDQGTTGTTALLISDRAEVVGRGYAEVIQHYPRDGWVEHDPRQIWKSVEESVAAALAAAPTEDVTAIGVTNQRETVVAWDAVTNEPLAAAIVWQDVRTSGRMYGLHTEAHGDALRSITGLLSSPYFSASKFEWLLMNDPDVVEARKSGRLRLGTVDTWLVSKLSGGAHVTDATNASRTLLFDLASGSWSQELLELFGVPLAALPELIPSSGNSVVTTAACPAGDGIPICGLVGDQQAALFGHLATITGATKVTYGTGCFLLQHAGEGRPTDIPGLLTTVALGLPSGMSFAYEGSVFIGGAVVQWLRDELSLVSSAGEIEGLARSVTDAGGVVFVPAFTGLGAPHWDPHARGTILGLTQAVTGGHIARAALEAIVHQVQDVLELMPAMSPPLHVDGGASANRLLLELQAEVCGQRVSRPSEIEMTALGVGYLAGIASGVWADVSDISELRGPSTLIEPGQAPMSTDRSTWFRAIERSSGWAISDSSSEGVLD
jgi:glycerol kinase